MGKQVDYPADTVGIDGTVYPTVGENIRHIVPLKNLRWVDVHYNITRGVKPDNTYLRGKFAGLVYCKQANPQLALNYYVHFYIEGTSKENTVIAINQSLYDYYEGDITISVLVGDI